MAETETLKICTVDGDKGPLFIRICSFPQREDYPRDHDRKIPETSSQPWRRESVIWGQDLHKKTTIEVKRSLVREVVLRVVRFKLTGLEEAGSIPR